MIARLKLKTVVDDEDAYEAQQFYNVIIQQLQQVVNVVTNPSDEAYNTCIEILQGSYYATQFEDLMKVVCEKNTRVKHYVEEKYKLRENSKLRPILERLRNHSQVIIISEKPVVLKWDNEHKLADNGGSACNICDIYDACDEEDNADILSKENSSNDTNSDNHKAESTSHASHTTHRSNSLTEESDTSQQKSPRNAGHINRIFQHSDIWICEDCGIKDDIWSMRDHNCRKYTNKDSLQK
jgi:hypothetical protein